MKKLTKKLFGWLKESNRPKHIKAGLLIYTVMLSVCLILGVDITMSSSISFSSTCIVAVAVDYKDKQHGCVFDWLDVIATVLLPGVVTIGIICLCKI